jgi:hypothetical protein
MSQWNTPVKLIYANKNEKIKRNRYRAQKQLTELCLFKIITIIFYLNNRMDE